MTKLSYLFLFGLLLAIEIGFLKVSKRIKNYKMIGSIILILTLVVLVVFKYQKIDKETLKSLPSFLKNNKVYQLYESIDYLVSLWKSKFNYSNTLSTQKLRKVSSATKKIVAAEQKWTCGHCQQLLNASYEIDHIKPLFKGGTNQRDNLMALCRNCHGEKTLRDQIAESNQE